MNNVLDSGSPARSIATSTATTRTANNATTPNTTTRQPTWRHTSVTANPPNIANTNSSSTPRRGPAPWVPRKDGKDETLEETLNETLASASPPTKAATKPLA